MPQASQCLCSCSCYSSFNGTIRWNLRLNAGGVDVVKSLTPGGQWPSVETATTSVRHGLCGGQAGMTGVKRSAGSI